MKSNAHFRSLALCGVLCAFSQAQEVLSMEIFTEPQIGSSISDFVFRPKPWWLRVATKKWQWVTIDPKIYYPKGIDPLSRPAVIEHEKVHLAQQRNAGKLKWLIKYAFSKKFRLDQELEPIIVEIAYTPLARRKSVAERYATSLSGSAYHRAAKSYDEALERILSKAKEMDVDVGN